MTHAEFPRLLVETGHYMAEWDHDRSAVPGDCDLEGLRPVMANVAGDLNPEASEVHHYPRNWSEPYLAGTLRTGQDIELIDCHMTAWPGPLAGGDQTHVYARWAVVGLGTRAIPGRRYDRVRLQVTGLDDFMMTNPVQQLHLPRVSSDNRQATAEERITGVLNPDRKREWSSDGVKIRCAYEHSMPMSGYAVAATFAPVVSMESADLLTLEEWISRWMVPFQRLVTFATRERQAISWITVHHSVRDDAHPLGESTTSGQVFGMGIAQEPYTARRPEPRPHTEQPLMTLPTLGVPLPQLIRRWHELDGSTRHPFVELYRLVLFTPDLPERARFLYLVQALEALQADENIETDRERDELHAERRSEALSSLKSADIDPPVARFIKDNLGKRPLMSLESRLKPLIDQSGEGVVDQTDRLLSAPLARELADAGANSFPEMIRMLRNELSHGSRNHAPQDLAPWANVLQSVANNQLLRLLKQNS